MTIVNDHNLSKAENLGYINIPKELDLSEDFYKPATEQFQVKALRKIKENPFVPIGC